MTAVRIEKNDISDIMVRVDMVAANFKKFHRNSAWAQGVLDYIEDLKENLIEAIEWNDGIQSNKLEEALLNGADNWKHFSYSGCSLIYNGDIAERLCNPTELKETDGGRRPPNSREEWLDVQTRALRQAYAIIRRGVNGWENLKMAKEEFDGKGETTEGSPRQGSEEIQG